MKIQLLCNPFMGKETRPQVVTTGLSGLGIHSGVFGGAPRSLEATATLFLGCSAFPGGSLGPGDVTFLRVSLPAGNARPCFKVQV